MSDTAKMIDDAATQATPPPNPLAREGAYDFAAAAVDVDVEKKLRDSARNVNFPGFRPGRVPLKVLWQRYGEGYLVDLLVAKTAERFEEEVKKGRQEQAAANLDVDPELIAKDGVYHVKFYYEILPAVAPPNLDGREVRRGVLEVGDKEIDAMIVRLQHQYGHYHAVTRPAQQNDRLKVSYESVVDEKVVEDGKDYYWILGSPTLNPEVTQKLLGTVVGDAPEVKLIYPEDYPAEERRGQTMCLKITVQEITELHPCELSDEFFARCGVNEGGEEAFRAEVGTYLRREVSARLESGIKTQALGVLREATPPFPLPLGMVQAEAQVIYRQMTAEAKKSGAPLPTDVRHNIYLEAARRTTMGLIMAEWIKREKVTVTDEEIAAAIQNMSKSYEDPAQFLSQVRDNRHFTEQMRLSLFESKTAKWTLERVKVVDEPLTVEQFFGEDSLIGETHE